MEEKKKRAHRRCKTEGNRICNMCEREMAATPEFFVTDSSRKYGVGYECLACHSERKKGRDRSKELKENLTFERHQLMKARALRYSRSEKGLENTKRNRASSLASTYRRNDKKRGWDNDIDKQFLLDHIFDKACTYCEDTSTNIGCDRIDNSLGHLKDNVLPCCFTCNAIRGNRLTVDEMRIIGPTVREVRNARIKPI